LKDEPRHERFAGRWLLRFLTEVDAPRISDAAFAASALAALGGASHTQAYAALLDMAEEADRLPRRGGVA
jgi:hypothetical protein